LLANGGNGHLPGGGGRVAVYFRENGFKGKAEAKAGKGKKGTAGDGTVVMRER
jgi:hypothetical protein